MRVIVLLLTVVVSMSAAVACSRQPAGELTDAPGNPTTSSTLLATAAPPTTGPMAGSSGSDAGGATDAEDVSELQGTEGSTTSTSPASGATSTTAAAADGYWDMRERDIEIVQGEMRIVFDTWFFAQLDELGSVFVYRDDELIFTGPVDDAVTENEATDFIITDPGGTVVATISRAEFDAAVNAIAEEFGASY